MKQMNIFDSIMFEFCITSMHWHGSTNEMEIYGYFWGDRTRERNFRFSADDPMIIIAWRKLAERQSAIGKLIFDDWSVNPEQADDFLEVYNGNERKKHGKGESQH